jgi:hypothetical protein
LLILFAFNASGFDLMGIRLNFTLLQPFGGCQVFSNINLVVAGCSPNWHGGHHVMICVFLVHVFTEFPNKIFFPCFEYQFHSCIFCVGLTFSMTRMEASIHFWIFFCSNFFSFW